MELKITEPGLTPINVALSYDDNDIAAAFTNNATPDVQLFYELKSPTLETRPVSEQLGVFQRFAVAVEAGRAANVNFANGTVADKGGV